MTTGWSPRTSEPRPSTAGAATAAGFYATIRDEMAMLLGEPGWRFTDEEPMMLVWYRTVSAEDGAAGPAS